MFYGCSNLISINLSNFDTSNVIYMYEMFSGCNSLTSLDLSNFNTSKTEIMYYMFGDCNSLTYLNIENFDISNVADMSNMFYNCHKLSYIKIKNFEANVLKSSSRMFYNCNSLTSIDFNKFIVKKVADLSFMFYNCFKLKSLDLSNFDTSLTTTMESMFSGCGALVDLNINNFNTLLVKNMNKMFGNCQSLTSLNLSSFNINEGTNTDLMFFSGSENLIYCINNISYTKIESQLTEKKCAIRDNNCLNGWSEIPNKIIAETGKCVDDCNSTINYKYEYNGKCYSYCPKGTTTLFNKNNDLVCRSFDVDEIFKMIEKEKETQEIIIEKTEKVKEAETQEIIIEKTEKIKETETQEEITEKKNKIIDNNILLYKYCAPNDFFKKECVPPKQHDYMIKLIKNDISEGKMNSLIEEILTNKKDIIETYDNNIYQITTTFNQKNTEYNNISTMEFDLCEEVLKDIYNISKNDPLIIFKYDYTIPELLIPIIGYELYHPTTKQILDLNYCKENKTTIDISIPVQINETEVYKHNPNDVYYKDKCNTDSNNKNLDITIYDKKNIYNEKNLALCPKNCEFDVYNNSTKKVKCTCEPQFNNSLLTLDNIINKKKLINNFVDIHSSTNFDIIKCYKKFLSKFGLKSNIGSYIILSIILIFIIGAFIFPCCEYKKIMNKVDDIAKNDNNNKKNEITNDIDIELNNPIKKIIKKLLRLIK